MAIKKKNEGLTKKMAVKQHTRIQTAEGWKRSQLRRRKLTKTASKE